MAGTYAEMAELATTNAFIDLCKVAVLKRAHELYTGTDKLTVDQLNLYFSILQNADGYAARMAWLVAATNATIGAAAPVVPTQSDTQFAVNTLLPFFLQ